MVRRLGDVDASGLGRGILFLSDIFLEVVVLLCDVSDSPAEDVGFGFFGHFRGNRFFAFWVDLDDLVVAVVGVCRDGAADFADFDDEKPQAAWFQVFSYF